MKLHKKPPKKNNNTQIIVSCKINTAARLLTPHQNFFNMKYANIIKYYNVLICVNIYY